MNLCTYLLPIRRTNFSAAEAVEFAGYFRGLNEAGCEVLVIDGSPGPVFEQHHAAWRSFCRHEPVDHSFGYLNDKVNGIHTGVALATTAAIILADDDIRYTAAEIHRACALLDDFEVVRPQNFISPLPWWGRMEAARMLINRATLRTADYPGTCAFRRESLLRIGHYDGDVLFDNEEMFRHFARSGAAVSYAVNLFVRKCPPIFRKWIEQRPRQAYEDFGLRAKTALFIGWPILAAVTGFALGRNALALYAATVLISPVALAVAGRCRGNASRYFPISIPLFAPLWILERTFSTYWALSWHFAYGGYPFGDKILSKGIGRDWIIGGRVAAAAAARQSNE